MTADASAPPRPQPGELIDAVRENNIALAKRLLRDGAEVNEKGALGKTPLGFAVSRASFEMSELLIAAGAEINVRNDLGSTLVSACINNMTGPAYEEAAAKILHLLIRKGVSLDNADRYGTNALQLARVEGSPHAEKIIDVAMRTRDRYAKLLVLKAERDRLLALHNMAIENQDELRKRRIKTVLKNKL